jgi:hypothetical protein
LITKDKIFSMSIDEAFIEEHLLGKSPKEIVCFMSKVPDAEKGNEWMYVTKKYLWGMYKRRLYLYFHNGVVSEYYCE